MRKPEFAKAKLVSVQWTGFGKVVKRNRRGETYKGFSWWIYHRYSNARGLYFGPFHIVWRWFWSKDAVYQKGWDHGFTTGRKSES